MTRIAPCPPPSDSLLAPYGSDGGYADCFTCEVDGIVPHAAFVEAFYTTKLFKLERLILRWLLRRPSTDAQAGQLARAEIEAFAAWTVEARAPDQLLLCDIAGRTRSWLSVAAGSSAQRTRLLFGSAVVPMRNADTGEARMGWGFRALLGFHTLYSRALLRAACARSARHATADPSRPK
jgi:hypothetical protein